MTCPLCGGRKARRGCPALGKQICAICCGTKRLTEIRCPGDCPYLASAREHPPAATVRQQQRDLTLFASAVRDFSNRQSELFLLVTTFLGRYASPELQPLRDDDVVDASAALAATLETASRGVIYDHRPASVPAERLVSALKTLLAEAGGNGGSAFDRDAALVFRRVEDMVRALRSGDGASSPGAFLELLKRVLPPGDDSLGRGAAGASAEPPRLIVP